MISPEYPPNASGIGNVVKEIQFHLSNYDVKVDVLSKSSGDVILSRLSMMPGQLGLLVFWERALDYLVKRRDMYDIVWFHSPLFMHIEKLRTIKKSVYTFHTTYYGFLQAFKNFKLNHLLPYYYIVSFLEKRLLNGLSAGATNAAITAVSDSVANELKENGLSAPIRVICNGLNFPQYSLGKREARLQIKKQFGLCFDGNEKILLYVGRITEVKLPMLIAETADRLVTEDPSIHLIMVGKGNLLEQIKKKYSHNKNIHLVGHMEGDKLTLFYRAADAFISLSCYEGLPLAALEASSFGLPLILSNISAHSFLSKIVPSNVLLVDTNEIKHCLESILSLIRNNGNGIAITKKEHLSWKSISREYLRLLEQL